MMSVVAQTATIAGPTYTTVPMKEDTKGYFKKYQDAVNSKPMPCCPHCGYCPHCGRSNYPYQYPYQWYPGSVTYTINAATSQVGYYASLN